VDQLVVLVMTSHTVHRCEYCCLSFGNAANVARHVQTCHPSESRLVGVNTVAASPFKLVFGTFNEMATDPVPLLEQPVSPAILAAETELVPTVTAEAVADPTVVGQTANYAATELATMAKAVADAACGTSTSTGCGGVVVRPPMIDTDEEDQAMEVEAGTGSMHDSDAATHSDMSTIEARPGGDAADVPEHDNLSGLDELLNVMDDEVPVLSEDIESVLTVSSTAARIRLYYESMAEATQAVPVVDPSWALRPSRFSSPALRGALAFALTAGGSGLTERAQVLFARTLRAVEKEATRGTASTGPMSAAFESSRSFLTATRHEMNRVLATRKWKKVPIVVSGKTYMYYFRDVLEAGIDAVAAASTVSFGDTEQLLALDLDADDDGRVRHGSLDSDLYQAEAQDVRRLHGADARVLGVQLHADEALVSWSGAKYMFPVRANFINNLDSGGTWVSVGYIEHVPKAVEKTAKARLAVSDSRNDLFQRCIAVSIRTLVRASEVGVSVAVVGRGVMRLFPRVVGLVVDQLEERNFYALMGNQCRYFCSICMEDRRASGALRGIRAVDRDVVSTLDSQLAAARGRRRDPRASRRRALGNEHSALAFVPALGAVHGLGTRAANLYRIVSFDVLHVWKLGILRMLAQRLPAVLRSLCERRDGARFGSVSATLDAVNLRGWELGRNCKATPAPPGYVCFLVILPLSVSNRMWSVLWQEVASRYDHRWLTLTWHGEVMRGCDFNVEARTDLRILWLSVLLYPARCSVTLIETPHRCFVPPTDAQATMTGRTWRHFSVFWPFMVAGAIGPRDPTDPTTRLLEGRPVAPVNRTFAARLRPPANESSSDDESAASDSDAGWRSETGEDAADPVAPLATFRKILPGADVARSPRYADTFGEMPLHDALLDMFCLVARLGGALFGDNIGNTTAITESQINAMDADAKTLGVDYVQLLYGHVHTTKLHRLVEHLGDELRGRGNLWEGDTSENERLHSTCKRMFRRSNKRGPDVALQMMRCDETQSAVLQELSFLSDSDSDSGDRSGDGSDARGAAEAPTLTSDLSFTGRGTRVAIGTLRQSPELANLGDLLDLVDGDCVIVHRTARIMARFEWGASTRMQHLRATANFMGKPWLSFVRYESSDGAVRWGRLRLVLRALGSERRSCVVLQRLRPVEARPGCVLSKYGCTRLAWDVRAEDTYPALELVDATRIYREEDIQVDWFDLSERLGLFATPSNTQDTEAERRASRFFTNPFFPWTSRALRPGL